MVYDLTQFHWLRPEWLLLLLPLLILIVSLHHLANNKSSWEKVVSPHLLKFLTLPSQAKTAKKSLGLISLICCISIIAISGPSFRQKPVPVFQTENARVVVLDLSLSMEATDIKPSRLSRAKHKLMDLLSKNNEGTIALIIYAGDAFIISPLTSDANTIATMVPTLSTAIMPVLGSRPDLAIAKAIELLNNAHQPNGQIVWITDGVESDQASDIIDSVKANQSLISILAIGTEQGAPIPLPDNSGFLKDNSGNIILPKLDSDHLKQIAHQTNGQYIELTPDSTDVDFILQLIELNKKQDSKVSEEKISRWIDDGYWLTWPLLLLCFVYVTRRKNLASFNVSSFISPIMASSLVAALLFAPNSQANLWDDLWKTKDQQAQEAFANKDFETAAELFKNPQWKAAADYKKGDYNQAIENFSQFKDTESLYNYGNSLAKAQKLEEAIEAYNQVLSQNPEHQDAQFNKKIVEDLLKQKNEQQQQQDQQKQQEQSEDQESKQDQEQDSDQNSDDKNQQQESEKDKEQKSNNDKQDQQQEEQEQQAKLEEDKRNKSEKDQALEHWLDKIPDDPGGLLRRKMIREYQRRGRTQKEKKLW